MVEFSATDEGHTESATLRRFRAWIRFARRSPDPGPVYPLCPIERTYLLHTCSPLSETSFWPVVDGKRRASRGRVLQTKPQASRDSKREQFIMTFWADWEEPISARHRGLYQPCGPRGRDTQEVYSSKEEGASEGTRIATSLRGLRCGCDDDVE